mmetsp:Transcript_5623/g.17825  ORF Transcript_5623/g.17825 Transcript_5623/m.17825 type:complete len:225 (+) Transcript_5623:932-1606(+)
MATRRPRSHLWKAMSCTDSLNIRIREEILSERNTSTSPDALPRAITFTSLPSHKPRRPSTCWSRKHFTEVIGTSSAFKMSVSCKPKCEVGTIQSSGTFTLSVRLHKSLGSQRKSFASPLELPATHVHNLSPVSRSFIGIQVTADTQTPGVENARTTPSNWHNGSSISSSLFVPTRKNTNSPFLVPIVNMDSSVPSLNDGDHEHDVKETFVAFGSPFGCVSVIVE